MLRGGNKGSVKTKGNGKGRNTESIQTRSAGRNCDGDGDQAASLRNERKVNKPTYKTKIPVAAKRTQIGSAGIKYTKRRKQNQTQSGEILLANFEEEGDMVQFELTPNQAQEFESETDGENSSDDESQNPEGEQSNTGQDQPEDDQDNDSEVVILRRTSQEIEEAEERDMLKFVNFMKKQGLVMVQTPIQGNNSSKKKMSKTTDWVPAAENRPSEGDGNSVVTIYQRAVEPASESKRDSTSSEELMDTSDEIPANVLAQGEFN